MQGSVATAKRLLVKGSCYGFVCSQVKCPLNTVEHLCNGNRRKLNAESVRKLQEFIKESERVLDLTKNQIVDPPVRCWVRDFDSSAWKEELLFSIDHRNITPFDTKGSRYMQCSLTDPTVPRYRPLNAEEISCMVGTVLSTKDRGFHILATAFSPISKEVFLGNEWCDANRLFDLYLRLDGSPVGVLIK